MAIHRRADRRFCLKSSANLLRLCAGDVNIEIIAGILARDAQPELCNGAEFLSHQQGADYFIVFFQ